MDLIVIYSPIDVIIVLQRKHCLLLHYDHLTTITEILATIAIAFHLPGSFLKMHHLCYSFVITVIELLGIIPEVVVVAKILAIAVVIIGLLAVVIVVRMADAITVIVEESEWVCIQGHTWVSHEFCP